MINKTGGEVKGPPSAAAAHPAIMGRILRPVKPLASPHNLRPNSVPPPVGPGFGPPAALRSAIPVPERRPGGNGPRFPLRPRTPPTPKDPAADFGADRSGGGIAVCRRVQKGAQGSAGRRKGATAVPATLRNGRAPTTRAAPQAGEPASFAGPSSTPFRHEGSTPP